MKNLVAIVGRPNVGKSTLFNKLIGHRVAIVHDEPGVTRDRLYHQITWSGKNFSIIDTGGIEIENRPFQEQIKIQAKIAIEEASVIVMVVDGREGLTNDDEMIIEILRRSNKPLIVAPNKLEGNRSFDISIWSLGVEKVMPISSAHGEGVGDLLDAVCEQLNFEEEVQSEFTKLAIIGRPNAGKSSLLNSLANEQRSIVSPIAGTTRDSVNSDVEIDGNTFTIIDTAGINKKSKLIESVEHYALSRALRTIEDSDIVLMLIDAERDIAHFDSVVGGFAYENDKPTIIIINKWDLIEKETMTMKNMEDNIRKNFKFLSWAPIVFISAKEKTRLNLLKTLILKVQESMSKRIKTSVVNELIADVQMFQPAPTVNGGRMQITFAKQIDAKIPTFTLFVNSTNYLHFSYERFLENQLRSHFGFEGTPIKLLFRNKNKGDEYE